MMYILYRIGQAIACALPLGAVYSIACLVADLYGRIAVSERRAMSKNFNVIFDGAIDEKRSEAMIRDVFRNFSKYLADFFRFSKIDKDYINRYVKIEGLKNLDEALSRRKGAILLSAHMGNWELGGVVISLLGYPLSAVVLTHSDKKVNDFFTGQRLIGKMRPIEIGMPLRSCYSVLRNNGLLGLLGDRDFLKRGLFVKFFGRKTIIPKGPAAFSLKLGSVIIPSFMLREEDDTFRLIFEEPIYPDAEPNHDEDSALADITAKYLKVLEKYIKDYPTQWYIFKEFWAGETVRPDTII